MKKRSAGVVLGVALGLMVGVGEPASGELCTRGRRDKTREREFMRYIESVQAAIDMFTLDHGGMSPFAGSLDWIWMLEGGYITTYPYNWAMPSYPWAYPVMHTAVAASDSATNGWTWDASTRTISATFFDEENLEFLSRP